MHPLLVPIGLLLLSAMNRGSTETSSSGPRPTPPPGGAPPPTPATPAQQAMRKIIDRKVKEHLAMRGDPYAAPTPAKPATLQIEHKDPVTAAQAPAQAAVDAAVSRAIREEHPAAQPAAAPEASSRSAHDAAVALQKFLLKTGRFGTLKDRPQEVKDAQRDMGLKPDGIVGKRTRTAAAKQGVALPPVK